jgi:carbonic anhydrase
MSNETKGVDNAKVFGRRELLVGAGGGALGFAAGWFGHDVSGMAESTNEPMPNGAQEALDRLKAGNERFATGRRSRRHQSAAWRHELETAQHPFATVLGCSNSRVPSNWYSIRASATSLSCAWRATWLPTLS